MDETGWGVTGFAMNGAVRLAYDDLGPATGEPLLMIMGLGASRFWWPVGMLQCLQAQGFRPAVVDLRDSGESTHVHQGSTGNPLWTMVRRPHRVRTVTSFASGSSDASGTTVLLRYLRWGTQLRLLRLVRRARTDDPELELAIFRACATPDYPVEESVVRDA